MNNNLWLVKENGLIWIPTRDSKNEKSSIYDNFHGDVCFWRK